MPLNDGRRGQSLTASCTNYSDESGWQSGRPSVQLGSSRWSNRRESQTMRQHLAAGKAWQKENRSVAKPAAAMLILPLNLKVPVGK